MKSRIERTGALAVLFVVEVMIACVIAELGSRAYLRYSMEKAITDILRLNSLPNNIRSRVPDPHSGYRYPPSTSIEQHAPIQFVWRTNSHGHVSSEEYPTAKPNGEFRIAAIGDSFTAGVTSKVRWPEVLQQLLNDSPDWRASVEGKFTRVINFGIDGTGFEQFAGVVEHHVPPFEADLVLVNFLLDDAWRKLRRASIQTPTGEIIAAMAREFMSGMNWFDFSCSFIVAAITRVTCGGVPSDVGYFMSLQSWKDARFSTREEAVQSASGAIQRLLAARSDIVFIWHPSDHELQGLPYVDWDGLLTEIQKVTPEWRYVDMRPRLNARLAMRPLDRPEFRGLTPKQLAALRDEAKPELYRWYYVPIDSHLTDYGNIVYAEELAAELIARHRVSQRQGR